jgi:hypothetical protein
VSALPGLETPELRRSVWGTIAHMLIRDALARPWRGARWSAWREARHYAAMDDPPVQWPDDLNPHERPGFNDDKLSHLLGSWGPATDQWQGGIYYSWSPLLKLWGLRHKLIGPYLGCSCSKCMKDPRRISYWREVVGDRVELSKLRDRVKLLERQMGATHRGERWDDEAGKWTFEREA